MSGRFWRMVFLLVLGVAGGCGKPEQPLRVGANLWPGYEPLFLAQSLDYFGGKPVRLISFPSTGEVIRAYRNGAIDVAAVTADEAIQISETLPDQRIILVCDFSKGADVILAKPPFASLPELRGHRIGVEQSATGAYVLARALEISGMTAREVTVIPLSVEEHEAAYVAGKVDAVVTFEPVRSRLLAAGANRLFDSSQIPGEVVDVLLAHPERMAAEEARIAALIDGWFRALDYLRMQPQDAARRVAPRGGGSPAAFVESLRGLELPGRAENARLLGHSPGNLAGVLRRLQTLMVQNNLFPRAHGVAVSLDDRFVRKGAP